MFSYEVKHPSETPARLFHTCNDVMLNSLLRGDTEKALCLENLAKYFLSKVTLLVTKSISHKSTETSILVLDSFKFPFD